MLIAPLPRVMLLSLRPAFEQLAAGLENLAARATALQDAQRVRRSNIIHAQLVRRASERQPRQPDEAPETARHVQIGAFRHRQVTSACAHSHEVWKKCAPHILRHAPWQQMYDRWAAEWHLRRQVCPCLQGHTRRWQPQKTEKKCDRIGRLTPCTLCDLGVESGSSLRTTFELR